jgi:hypothetical protein
MKKNPHIGSSLDDFLKEYNMIESSKKVAILFIFDEFFKNPKLIYNDISDIIDNHNDTFDLLIKTIKRTQKEDILKKYLDFRDQYIKSKYDR